MKICNKSFRVTFRFLLSLSLVSIGSCRLNMAMIRRNGGNLETSSTLAWMAGGRGPPPPHAVPLNEDDPSQGFWCRAEQHGTHISGALRMGTCTVPFLGKVLSLKDKFEVLVSFNGSARVRYQDWDSLMAPPDNAIAAADYRVLAVLEGEDGTLDVGFLAPHERRAQIVSGRKAETIDKARVLYEDMPVRYDLRSTALDPKKTDLRYDNRILLDTTLSNPGPSQQHVVEEAEVVVAQKAYWGQIKGTVVGLSARVVSPAPANEEQDLTWGIQNEYDSVQEKLLEYQLPPGTAVDVQVVGQIRKTEAPYSGTITAIYSDGATRSRVINGLHIDERLIQLSAVYGVPYYIADGTPVPGLEKRTEILYKSTTTTTTTTTTTSTTTTPETPKASMVGPPKPKSLSQSTSNEAEEIQEPKSLDDGSGVASINTNHLSLVLLACIVAMRF